MDDGDRELRDLERKILKIEGDVYIKVVNLESSVNTLKEEIKKLVSIERFNPVAYIAYGLAAGVLTTALGAILSKSFSI